MEVEQHCTEVQVHEKCVLVLQKNKQTKKMIETVAKCWTVCVFSVLIKWYEEAIAAKNECVCWLKIQ